MRTLSTILAGAAAAVLLSAAAQAQVTMKASHQFPGGKGDVRDDMVQMIAKEAKAANVGLDIQVYPGASLFKPNDQWNAMVNGQLDITLFPLDYASGKVPAFSATLMPGLIRSQDRAKRINDSQFMKDVRAEIEKHGVIVLSDAWFAGGMASNKGCLMHPNDLKGLQIPRRRADLRRDVGSAGASIVSPPSNEIYNAFQSGVVNATDTSLGTFQSMRLYEVTDCLTAPGNNALWFMYEPVLMSKKSFDKLNSGDSDCSTSQSGRRSELVVNLPGRAVWESLLGRLVVEARQTELTDVIRALNFAGRLAGCLNRRQEDRDQDADDRDHDQQLDQRKTTTQRGGLLTYSQLRRHKSLLFGSRQPPQLRRIDYSLRGRKCWFPAGPARSLLRFHPTIMYYFVWKLSITDPFMSLSRAAVEIEARSRPGPPGRPAPARKVRERPRSFRH